MYSILTVDDEKDICEMIASFMERKGYKVKTALSGEDALRSMGDDKPDIVLLDLHMPGLGGEGTLKEIKKQYKDIPVIILTVNNAPQKALELLKLGAMDYMSKPIDLDCLEKNISVWQSLSKGTFQ